MIKKTILLTFLLALMFIPVSRADTVYLKNGKKLQGRIVEKTDKQIKISIKGVALTYYAEDIERIDYEKAQEASSGTLKTPEVKSAGSSAVLQSFPGVTKLKTYTVSPAGTVGGESGGRPPIIVERGPRSPERSGDPSLSGKSRQELILEFIEAYGVKENMAQMFSQIVAEQSPEEAEKIRAVLNVDEIIKILIPVYEKYFTDEDLKELISFYHSATYRKLIQIIPMITKESIEVTKVYFEQKMQSFGR